MTRLRTSIRQYADRPVDDLLLNDLLTQAERTQIYKLRSLTNSGDLYLHVKNNDLQGVIITQPMKYLKNQMFQLVKNVTSGQYAIKCIADNSMLLNSTGNNHWDRASSTSLSLATWAAMPW